MTLYIANPSAMLESRNRMLRRFLAEKYDSEPVMTFPVELKESDEEYLLKALLPGLKTDEVNIQLNDGILSIEGEYKESEESNDLLINEFPTGRFARSFELNSPVVVEKIDASMSEGVLTVHLPKAEEAKPRTIKIIAK